MSGIPGAWCRSRPISAFPVRTPRRRSNASLDDFLRRRAPHEVAKEERFRLVPLLDAHLSDAGSSDAGSAAVVAAFSLVGFLALLIAGANYVNLATAGAALRAREVGMRKVLGATRPELVGQFLVETAVAVGVAALASLALAELALPFVNAISGVTLALDSVGAGLTLAVAAAVVILAAGLYPALVLSSYRPAAVLASSAFRGGGRMGTRLREGLVVRPVRPGRRPDRLHDRRARPDGLREARAARLSQGRPGPRAVIERLPAERQPARRPRQRLSRPSRRDRRHRVRRRAWAERPSVCSLRRLPVARTGRSPSR